MTARRTLPVGIPHSSGSSTRRGSASSNCVARKEYHAQKWLEEQLENEVTEYNYYLTGQAYGFILREKAKMPKVQAALDNLPPQPGTTDGSGEDSCWGFLGSDLRKNGILDQIPSEFRAEIEAKI